MSGFWATAGWDVLIIREIVMKGSAAQKTSSGDLGSVSSSASHLLSNFQPVIASSGTQFAHL